MLGNPRCEFCQGRGGKMIHGRYVRCNCNRPTPQVQAMLQKAQAGRRPFKTLTQLIQETDKHD